MSETPEWATSWGTGKRKSATGDPARWRPREPSAGDHEDAAHVEVPGGNGDASAAHPASEQAPAEPDAVALPPPPSAEAIGERLREWGGKRLSKSGALDGALDLSHGMVLHAQVDRGFDSFSEETKLQLEEHPTYNELADFYCASGLTQGMPATIRGWKAGSVERMRCEVCRGRGASNCRECGGQGQVAANAFQTCPRCQGAGQHRVERGLPEPCHACAGEGGSVIVGGSREVCGYCGGDGQDLCFGCGGDGTRVVATLGTFERTIERQELKRATAGLEELSLGQADWHLLFYAPVESDPPALQVWDDHRSELDELLRDFMALVRNELARVVENEARYQSGCHLGIWSAPITRVTFDVEEIQTVTVIKGARVLEKRPRWWRR